MESDGRVRRRLSVMMVLVYSVQGAFWPLLSIHLVDLGVAERGRGWIFATMALGSFAVPMGAGQLVDRLMPTQRFLSISFGAGTVLLALMGSGVTSNAGGMFGLFLAYWLIMSPNYSLSSSIAFRNLARPDRDFGKVRLWGTVGWMASGWLVSGVMAWSGSRSGRGTPEAFWVAVGLSGATALYCRFLPDTPPIKAPGNRKSWARDVSDLVRSPSMGVYLLAAFGVSLTTPFVYQVMPNYLRAIGMDRAWVGTAMTLGQWPEIAALAALPWLIGRYGYRATLGLGIAAYLVRYGMLALDPSVWLATAGIPLHGIGVACFTIGGQMFVDGRAPADRRASAQSLNTVVTGGLGSLLGSLLAGEVVAAFPGRFGMIFLVPCAINASLLAFLLLMFRPTIAAPQPPDVPVRPPAVEPTARPVSAGG